MKIQEKKYLIIFLLPMLWAACGSNEPKAIEYGKLACHYCNMNIVDKQHAAQLITSKGKVYMFDAIECMTSFMHQGGGMEKANVYVTVFDTPGKWVVAQKCHYLVSKNLPSPMGEFLTAFEQEAEAKAMHEKKGGEMMDWEKVRTNILLKFKK